MSDTEQTPTPKRSRKMVLLIGVGAVSICGAGGFFAWKHLHPAKAAPAHVVADVPAMIELPVIMSNLDTDAGHNQFVKLSARLEIARSQDRAAVEAAMPQVLDVFQTYLHETRPEELSGGGLYRLREAMLQQVANTLAPVQVRDLYFTELLTQ